MTAKTSKKRRLRPVDLTFSKAFKNYTPPEDLTVSEWAATHRVLSPENSAEAGPWNNNRTPYLVEVMDAFTDPRVEKITLVASSQVGKSELELNIIGYIIDQDPGSILYIQPTLDDAKKFSRLRIAPMLRDSGRLRSKVADVKSRDSGNTMFQKSFPGGMLTLVGSNSASGLASTPAKYILGDERDRWALSAGTEGDPWGLAEARTTTFYNSKMVDVSTPTIKGFSPIEESFDAGTRERWCNQCPECGDWHNIVFGNIKFKFDTVVVGKKKDYVINSIDWCCPSCGCLSSEELMRRQPAKWIAENPQAIDKGHRSFWLNAFASPWQPWSKVVYAFLTASGNPAKLKVVYNTMLGELWEERGEIADEDTMLERREDYGHRSDGSPIELPEGVLVLTCGVDTQNDRLEYEVIGHGHYGETWGIKKGIIMGDPHESEVWERLDDVIEHVYKFVDPSRGLMISQTFVDSGGHKTQDVYRECRKRLNRRVFSIKGVGGDGVPYTRPPGKAKIVVNGRVIGETWLYSIGVDAGKSDIMNNIKVQEPGAKYCHFPLGDDRGYDSTFFNGLLSEKLVQRTVRGRTRWAWQKIPGHERNEALDCRNYALAAFRALDPDLEAVERKIRGLTEQQKREPEKKKRQKVKKNSMVHSDW
ncbi:phage terminase large subunit family protein [Paenibacillus apiarius]|uniref:phage terminase large subunit family protein n=1 Tax=Paenibacillus apiarius TaxID=46240 RepID=UPI003B3B3466